MVSGAKFLSQTVSLTIKESAYEADIVATLDLLTGTLPFITESL